MYPLLFDNVYQHYLWGGDRIIKAYGRSAPDGIYAESWEVSDRPEGMSVVRNGALAGQTLAELMTQDATSIVGKRSSDARFPLLVKLLDARETLSVQVHPDDAAAAQHGGEPKTEMWYVLAADEGACVYSGFKPNVTESVFRQALADGEVADLLCEVPVQAGDTVFMPGGRVHAIGSGCMMLEVQQNSNTTYRLFDWGRVGMDGQPRDLHVEQGAQVIRWQDQDPTLVPARLVGRLETNEIWEVLNCSLFRMERLQVRDPWPSAHDGQSFQILFCAEGSVCLQWEEGQLTLSPGTTCLIPACVTAYTVTPLQSNPATLLRVAM